MSPAIHALVVAVLGTQSLAAGAQQPSDTMARPQIQPPVTLPAPVRPSPPPGRPPPGRPQPQPVRPLPVQPGNGANNGWNNGSNNGFDHGGSWSGATIRCESHNYRYAECRANTDGGVRLVRVRGGQCRQGQSWGYRPGFVWVNHGCRADFQLRHGSGQSSGGGGPSAGAIIGGVAVAGGLIALLSQGGNAAAPPANPGGNPAPPLPAEPPVFQPPAPPHGPARITAEMGGVTPSARPSLQTCLDEAARQIGTTGGTEIRLDRLDDIQPGNGGYRFRFRLQAIYPDEIRAVPTFCRATPTTVVELTFG